MPDLSFGIDKSIAHGARIDQLLSDIEAKREAQDVSESSDIE